MKAVKMSSALLVVPLVAVGFGFDRGSDGPALRLASVTSRSVAKTLDTVGTIEPVSAASVAFPIAGTVASVAVKAGDTVTRGQTLAALDVTSLQFAVDAAQAALTEAKLALATARTVRTSPADTPSSEREACDAIPECRAALEAVLQAEPQPTARGESVPTAADISALQEAIDAAEAGVDVATQNLSAATIVSPIDGTIEAVDVAVGDDVTAASTTAVLKVVGTGGYEVTAIVAVDKLAQVKVGQPATVTPDASPTSFTGKVVAIGAPITSNGATSYPVSIGLDDDAALRNGTVADVRITTASVDNGLAVPTSAVHVETTGATVTVMKDGKPTAKSVVVGVVGRAWTQIKSGLTAGQQVVLADLSEPLPGSATSSSNGSNRGNPSNEVVFIGRPPGATGAGPIEFKAGG